MGTRSFRPENVRKAALAHTWDADGDTSMQE